MSISNKKGSALVLTLPFCYIAIAVHHSIYYIIKREICQPFKAAVSNSLYSSP